MTGLSSIVWVGFHEEGRFALPALIERGFPIKAVITLTDEAASRRSGAFDVEKLAQAHGIPCHKVAHINDESSITLLRSYAPDVLCVIGWSQILSAEALGTAGITIGAHASLLPEGKGSAPINWAIIKGLQRTGNTLMQLSEGVDEGDMLAQIAFDIDYEDTCATLYDKVAETNATMLIDVLGRIRDGTLEPEPQPMSDEPLWPRRRPEDGLIHWEQGGRQVYDFVRALTRPYPGAFGYVGGKKVTIWRAAECRIAGAPGAVIVDNAVRVACGDGGIEIVEAGIEGNDSLQDDDLREFFMGVESFDAP